MSEPFLKPRSGAGGYDEAGRRSAAPAGREDPLAELARLIGKEDPFRGALPRQPGPKVSMFPQPAAPEPPPEPEAPLTAEDDGIGDFHEPGYPDFDAQLRGSLDGRAALAEQGADEAARPRDALRFPPMPETDAPFEPSLDHDAERPRGEAPPLNADLWAEGALPQEGEPASFAEAGPSADDGRGSRRTMAVLAAVVVLVGGGLGATLAMHGGTGVSGGNGTPPTIAASDQPVKVQSPDMTNGGNPDGNTALLEKTDSDKVDHAKVVTNNEQPVDLNQLPKAAAAQPDASQPAPAGATDNGFPEPRKVKTVMIRPDGSLVDAAPQVAPVTPVGMVMPAGADADAAATDSPAPPPAPAPVAKPASPKSTARVTATPKDAASAGGASGAKQAAAPAHPPKPKAAPVVVADATPAEEAPAAAAGSWAVQLAAPGTEQEAKDTASRLQKKYADQLGGSRLSVRKASDKAVYRVRVGNLTQDDAKALCGKLQAAGGTCFSVRN